MKKEDIFGWGIILVVVVLVTYIFLFETEPEPVFIEGGNIEAAQDTTK
jgi:hypothetical protein